MKCDRIVKRYLEQQDIAMPLSVRIHLLHCSKCRREIYGLFSLFADARIKTPFQANTDLSSVIMQKIALSGSSYEKRISFSQWLSTGIIILLSTFAFSYSDSFLWLRYYFGKGLELPVYLIMGTAITIYSVLFISSHLEDAKKILVFLERK